MQSRDDNVSSRRPLPSLRVLLTIVAVAPAVVGSALLLTIASITGRSTAEQLAEQTMRSANERASSEIRDYLSVAVRASDRYTRDLADGTLNPDDLATWRRRMAADLATAPQIASVCFGTTRGDATYFSRAHGRLEYGLVAGDRPDQASEFVAAPSGEIDRDRPIRVYRYDPRVRPWYATAVDANEPLWTPVYFWFGDKGADSETGSGYTRVIRDDRDGNVRGVLVIDITLSALSDFLRRLPLSGAGGAAFIVDDHDLLVAASFGHVNSPAAQRLSAAESDAPAVRAAAAILAPHVATAPAAGGAEKIRYDGIPARARVVSLMPYPGMHWRLVTVLPESTFLTQVRSMQKRAAMLALVVVAGAVGLGLALSKRLSVPLSKLASHVARVGGGDFDARLHLRLARELRTVSEEVNNMAAGLKHRVELEQSLALATHVQQSLLPEGAPQCVNGGLDVAGRSQYCDSTGGDYFDFIDIAELPGDRILIAVGDVMGHGIGAALLMATARGALRACAAAGVSLGEIARRVNHVLASDSRHGLFMTLSLLVIDPRARRATYASAGHDPPILFDPATGKFDELDGGDVPLGIAENIVYEQYERDGLPDKGVLVIGTDGIWEARHAQSGEMFGKDRLRDLIRAHAHEPAKSMAAAIEATLAAYVHPERPKDDVTFVIARWGEIAATASSVPTELSRYPTVGSGGRD